MTPYQYRKSYCGDKTILRPSYLHNEISCTDKRTSLYWIGAQNPDKIDRKRLRLESPPPIVGIKNRTPPWFRKQLRVRKAPRYTFPRIVMYVCSNISHHLNRALRNQLNPITKVMDIFVRLDAKSSPGNHHSSLGISYATGVSEWLRLTKF